MVSYSDSSMMTAAEEECIPRELNDEHLRDSTQQSMLLSGPDQAVSHLGICVSYCRDNECRSDLDRAAETSQQDYEWMANRMNVAAYSHAGV
jgi:hypothetical protein